MPVFFSANISPMLMQPIMKFVVDSVPAAGDSNFWYSSHGNNLELWPPGGQKKRANSCELSAHPSSNTTEDSHQWRIDSFGSGCRDAIHWHKINWHTGNDINHQYKKLSCRREAARLYLSLNL